MKKIMLTTSAFLFSLALTTGAFAAGDYGSQSGASGDQPQSGAQVQQDSQSADLQQTAGQLDIKSADELIGKAVKGAQGEDIGNISDLMIDSQTGQVGYALVSAGGVLGMGEDQFIVPWNALQTDPQSGEFSLNISQEKLQQAPKGETVADRSQAQEIHQFYGVSPYWEEGAQQQMMQQDQQQMEMRQDQQQEPGMMEERGRQSE